MKKYLNFPKPIYINKRRYFRQSMLERWERDRAASKSEAA